MSFPEARPSDGRPSAATSSLPSTQTPGFLDTPGVPLSEANVVVISAPYEGSVTYGAGAAGGPAAILRASGELETFDEEMGWDLADRLRICTLSAVEPAPGELVDDYVTRLRGFCAGLSLEGRFPLLLGGEHSVTSPVLSSLRPCFDDVTVVQIDAHADLRDRYQGSAHNHACAMRRVLDLGVRRLVAVGIRSAEAAEFELARTDGRISTHYAHALQSEEGWQSLLGELRAVSGPTYLTVDIDGLDLPLSPGTGTPQPGGLTWYQATQMLRALLRESHADVFGADVTETVPQPHSQVNELVAAKLALKILSYRRWEGRSPSDH